MLPSLSKKGDYIYFFAHMDSLVALSACPGNQAGFTEINAGSNKPLKAEIWEESG